MILLTGATGFLGRHLIPRLVKSGVEVRALVRPSSNVAFLQEWGVELAYADDISDATAVKQACRGCNKVIHAAGLFRFWGSEAAFHKTNVLGTTAVLQAAISVGIERFIHISSIAVVGNSAVADNSVVKMIHENSICHPQEPYQISKFEGEKQALNAYKKEGLPLIVLRPGAFYGPWGRYAFNRLFFEEPLKGWRIKVDGGRHITFPVFVPDVAQGVMLALDNGRLGQIYNICGQSLDHNSVNDIVSDLADISRWRFNIPSSLVMLLARSWTALSRLTKREPFYPVNMAPYVFQDWHVSNEKAKQELGFVPTPFTEGVQKTLEWYWEQGILRRMKDEG